ncbi:MAG: pullulanase-type alpha-1,6-glucosidase [Balneolaceae bacterium]|nr:MAG: pullulanase-type alpha-1,6-glucosidase [Balneolaceae bacterium]
MRSQTFSALLILWLITGLQALSANPVQDIEGASAHWVSESIIVWDAGEDAVAFEIRYSNAADITVNDGSVKGGVSIPLEPTETLPALFENRFRHLAELPAFTHSSTRDELAKAVQGQLIAIAYDAHGSVTAAARVQFPGLLDDLFFYSGSLGPLYHDEGIQLKVWAPTARELTLRLFDQDKNLLDTIGPDSGMSEKGVWTFSGPPEWDRLFYRFDVTVYHPLTNRTEQYEVTDPYSVSLSTDSEFSQFADLAGDPDLKPEGWDSMQKVQKHPVDITIYEAHVRDFSMFDDSVPAEHRGKYLAFTYNGKDGRSLSNGMNHLQKLSDAGLTHLHLLPVNDIASVIEDKNRRVDITDPCSRIFDVVGHDSLEGVCDDQGDRIILDLFEELAKEDPVTQAIQFPYSEPGRMEGMARFDGFNWGYDPFHFNAPEGSYATEPDGTARIMELRKMVQALYQSGLYTVIDVVYNHTFASGTSSFSVLDRLVPGYYHRYNADTGVIETSTCCDNTAAEHKMMEKLLIDSVLLWAQQYKIDSFRFDLMGHHPRYVMENLLDSLAKLTPEEHGVDGANLYIYGEGWNFGEVADNRIFEQATQFNMGGTGIGNFNDRIRDAIKGGFYSWSGRHQGFTTGQYLFPNEDFTGRDEENLADLLAQADRIRVGMAGNLSTYPYINRFGETVTGANEYIGYTVDPRETINYIDKHDNETLWDNNQVKIPMEMDLDSRVRIHLLANAFLNYGQGIPFYQMGSDFLRSKSLDRNSFDSGDWFNRVDFTMETHNWATGLPPAWDNRDRWDEMEMFMTLPGIKPGREEMEWASEVFREQLQVRYSSPLFRLRSADEIRNRVRFLNTGPDQVPGLIVMTISDGQCAGESLDPSYEGIMVLFNADRDEQSFHHGLDGLSLHPILQSGRDESLRSLRVGNGTVTLPAHSAVVLVREEGSGAEVAFPCNL